MASAPLAVRREARRQVVNVLKLAEALVAYSARQLGSGLGPEQARAATMETAAELEATAAALRRLTVDRLTSAERRALAVQMHSFGLPTKAIAVRLAVSDRAVRYYLHGRPEHRRRTAAARADPGSH